MRVTGPVLLLIFMSASAYSNGFGLVASSNTLVPREMGVGGYASFGRDHFVLSPQVTLLGSVQTTYSSAGAVVSSTRIWAVAPALSAGYSLSLKGMSFETIPFLQFGSDLQLQSGASMPALYDPFHMDAGIRVALPAGRWGKVGLGASVPLLSLLPDGTWKWIGSMPDLHVAVRIGVSY